MRICVYEDRHVPGLEPLTLTRPAADLVCGLDTLAAKHARYFGATAVGHLCRPAVAALVRPRAPVNDPAWLRAGPTVLVNARWLPPAAPRTREPYPFADGPHLGTVGVEVAYAVLDTNRLKGLSPATLEDCLADWAQALPTRDAGGAFVSRPWDLIDHNPAEIARDFDADADPTEAGFHPTGFVLVGPADRLFIHPTARVDPMVAADTTNGPVAIGPGAVVRAFTHLEGPCGVGAGAVVSGAKVRGGTTIGPHCRVGGEVEGSILLGYANKHHDGFLGHSYVGEWVNLAAGTQTSDLRCDYRPVTAACDGGEVPTGRTKLGAVIGDHAKTGVGVLLNCGSVVGPFAQLLPCGGYSPRWVPGFHRAGPDGLRELTDTTRHLATASAVMRRRGRELTPALEAVYRSAVAAPVADAPPTLLPMRRAG